LPSPSAAAIVAGGVWFGVDHEIAGGDVALVAGVLTLAVGLLMVSNIRFQSFKQIDFRGKVPFFAVVAVALGAAVVLSQPATILFLGFFLYALSGPVMTLLALRRRRGRRPASGPQ